MVLHLLPEEVDLEGAAGRVGDVAALPLLSRSPLKNTSSNQIILVMKVVTYASLRIY